MKKTKCQIGCSVFFLILGLLLIGSGVFLWVGFYTIYDKAVDDTLVLQADKVDGRLSKTTFWFVHPPNPSDIEFFGQKPWVEDIGPFAIHDLANKWNYSFNEDGTRMKYKNYQTYIYNKNDSCGDCDYDRVITLPNLVAIGTIEELLDPKYNVSIMEAQLIDFFMLLVGEYAFIDVKVGDILFDGYEDAMLSAAHSQFVDDLAELNNGKSIIPVPVPDMTTMAMFYHYNNTNDEEYEVYTGKDDITKVGQITKWANSENLPDMWWSDEKAKELRGSDNGGLQTSRLSKKIRIEFFQSFMCRSFDLGFTSEEKVGDIPTYKFEGGAESFDTTLPEQAGFRYPNTEGINYFADWPLCPTVSPNVTAHNCTKLDCFRTENMCNPCCSGSYINDTYQLPPGFYPINCYPGRVQETPFRLLFSTPHFASSPPEVRNSIRGLKELGANKHPFSFKYLPRIGACLEANIRFQIAIPVYNTQYSIMLSHMPNKIIPVLWDDNHVKINNNAYNKFYEGFVVVPRVVTILRYVFPSVGVLFVLIGIVILVFKGKSDSLEISTVEIRTVSKL
ncbi:Protein CBR-SCAV-6 [Aphelenchoides besseyi]|nr:Protein CBR-SCAV-6 [Aphelenchoides besseyi]